MQNTGKAASLRPCGAPEACASKGMPQTILVVDDTPLIRDLVHAVLSARGYQVLVAEHGANAFDVFAGHAIDAAVIDIDMPGMNGIDVCRELRARAATANRRLPVWMITGAVRPELAARAAAAGALGILPKPFTPAQLLEHVERALAIDHRSSAA